METAGKIGYGRPPTKYQFRKGQSGNLKGRPKQTPRAAADIIKDVLNASTAYNESGQKKIATRIELSLKALRNQALTGSIAAAAEILKLIKSAGKRGGQIPSFRVVGWLPDYPGQTGDQKNRDNQQV